MHFPVQVVKIYHSEQSLSFKCQVLSECAMVLGTEPTHFIGFLQPTKKVGPGDVQEAWVPGRGTHVTPLLRKASSSREAWSLIQLLQESSEMFKKHLSSFEVSTKENNCQALQQTTSRQGTLARVCHISGQSNPELSCHTLALMGTALPLSPGQL